jgi:energy-coupling factor transport system substrate-specific component
MPESTSSASTSAAATAARIATLALIPSAVAFNFAIGSVVRTVKLPIYLDCIGGIATTLIAGVWPGVAVAGLSQIIGSLTAPDLILYVGTAVAMGLYAHVIGKASGFKTLPRALIAGIGMGFLSAMASFGITAWRGGVTSAGSSFVTLFYLHHGFALVPATILSGLTCDPIDKIAECLITVWLIRSVPMELLSRFRGGTLDRNFGVPSPTPSSSEDLPFMVAGGLVFGAVGFIAASLWSGNNMGWDALNLHAVLSGLVSGSTTAASVFVRWVVCTAVGSVLGVLAGSAAYNVFGRRKALAAESQS